MLIQRRFLEFRRLLFPVALFAAQLILAPAVSASSEDSGAPAAEESKAAVGQTHDGKAIVENRESVDADSSEAMRQDKRGSVVVETGLAVGAIPTSGIAAGFYLDPSQIVEASYVSGSIDVLFFEVKGSLAELRWKKFWGNSFYSNLGLGYRTVGFEANLPSLVGGPSMSSSFNTTSIGASIGIGNRWQWENFTLGCDWVGYFIPFANTGDTDIDVPGADPEHIKDLEESGERLGKVASSQLLRFYLGVSF